MSEVGPAGRWFMRPKVRGRRTRVRISGGRRVVNGRVERRNDYIVALALACLDLWVLGVWKGVVDVCGYVRQTCDSPRAAQ